VNETIHFVNILCHVMAVKLSFC